MKKLALIVAVPVALAFAWSIAGAQDAVCPNPIAQYTQVKNSCFGGHMGNYYDDNKCLMYKCVPNSDSSSSSSVPASAPPSTTCEGLINANIKVRLICTRTQGIIIESQDSNGCQVLQCSTSSSSMSSMSNTATLQCKKTGCTMTCSDGMTYNVCPQSCSMSSSSAASSCTRKPSGRCSWVTCGTSVKRVCP